jgi:hypothetical protein
MGACSVYLAVHGRQGIRLPGQDRAAIPRRHSSRWRSQLPFFPLTLLYSLPHFNTTVILFTGSPTSSRCLHHAAHIRALPLAASLCANSGSKRSTVWPFQRR